MEKCSTLMLFSLTCHKNAFVHGNDNWSFLVQEPNACMSNACGRSQVAQIAFFKRIAG